VHAVTGITSSNFPLPALEIFHMSACDW